MGLVVTSYFLIGTIVGAAVPASVPSEEIGTRSLLVKNTQAAGKEMQMSVTISFSFVHSDSDLNPGIHEYFAELHVRTQNGDKETDRVIWRELFTNPTPGRKINWFSDVIFDPEKDLFLLCFGADDRFGLYIIPLSATPRFPEPPDHFHTDKEFHDFVNTPPKLTPMVPPHEMWLQLPGIHSVNLHKQREDVQISILVAKNKPPVIWHYSLATKQWRAEGKKKDVAKGALMSRFLHRIYYPLGLDPGAEAEIITVAMLCLLVLAGLIMVLRFKRRGRLILTLMVSVAWICIFAFVCFCQYMRARIAGGSFEDYCRSYPAWCCVWFLILWGSYWLRRWLDKLQQGRREGRSYKSQLWPPSRSGYVVIHLLMTLLPLLTLFMLRSEAAKLQATIAVLSVGLIGSLPLLRHSHLRWWSILLFCGYWGTAAWIIVGHAIERVRM